MTYILQIDSSTRDAGSHSKTMRNKIVDSLLLHPPSLEKRVRDLNLQPLPHISNDTITGFYSSPEVMTTELANATNLSDTLIDELTGASTLVISSPVYNLSVPSCFKAWFDQLNTAKQQVFKNIEHHILGENPHV